MRAAGCLALIILLTLPIHATIVKRLDLDGLVSVADTIVAGKVRSSDTYWSRDGRLILTRHTIQVDETLKGFPSGTLEVTTIGGTIGDRTLYVAGMPAFAKGERTILFLEAAGLYTTVVGLGQGKFSVANDFVSNNVSQLQFDDGRRPTATRMWLDEFKNEIRRRVNR